jgi:hypothetical protein
MKTLTAFACFLIFVTSTEFALAQVLIRQAGGGATPIMTSRIAGYGGATYVPEDVTQMLSLPQFAKELQLTDSQQKELLKIRQKSQEATQKMWQEMRQPAGNGGVRQFDAATWQKTRDAQQKARENAEKSTLAVLNGEQKDRLKQIRVQLALRNRGVTSLGASGGVFGDAINLTDEQKKKLQEKQREIRQELQKMMAELKEEMEQEALDEVLTDSQLATLKKLRGDHYEIKRPDYSKIYGRPQTPAGRLQQGAKKLIDDVKKDFEDRKPE